MKNFIGNLIFGKDPRLSGLFALVIVALVALGCTCGKDFDFGNIGSTSNSSSSNTSTDSPFGDDDDSSEMPDDRLLKAMVKETTADFALAISTEDFSKIYEKASTDFQRTYTQEQMKEAFKDFINKKRLVLPILAKTVSMDPELTPAPSIRTESGLNILVVNGRYATKPVPVRFEYQYVKRGGTWKLLILKIYVT